MTTPLEYRGYQATVAYENGRLVIHVLHVSDHLVAECTDAASVEREFQTLIDEYIEDCTAIGKAPEKPFKGIFNVRVSPELHRLCVKTATAEGSTLNDFVGSALAEAVCRRRPIEMVGAAWIKLSYPDLVYRMEPLPVYVGVANPTKLSGPGASAVDAWTKAGAKERPH